MPKPLRIVAYICFALISFGISLYITFPFDILKDRMLADVEKGLKGKYEVVVASVSPRLLVGVTLKGVKVNERSDSGIVPVWEAEKVRLNASILSLILRRPSIKFDIISGDGELQGHLRLDKASYAVDMTLDDLDLSKITLFSSKFGLMLKSSIGGKIDLEVDPVEIMKSAGNIEIEPNGIKIMASKLKTETFGEVDIPEMVIGAGKSLISAELKRGALKINSLKFESGDLNLDLKGNIYLSPEVANYRLNLKGTFGFSEKVEQALPFLFIIEKQKKEDGEFPISIAGRLAKPQIKIGDFTVPM